VGGERLTSAPLGKQPYTLPAGTSEPGQLRPVQPAVRMALKRT
jgi:hypothetical protein